MQKYKFIYIFANNWQPNAYYRLLVVVKGFLFTLFANVNRYVNYFAFY